MRLTIISPRLAIQKGDFLGSGVPYWPVELATLAAWAREAGDEIELHDLFGANPSRLTDAGDHYLQGVPIAERLEAGAAGRADAVIVFAISYMSHAEVLEIVRRIRTARPGLPIAVLENSQAVTGYSLERVAPAFFEAGASMIVCGEPYADWPGIKAALLGEGPAPANVRLPGSFGSVVRPVGRGVKYPIPAWDLFELERYWALPYSHGPKTRRFLPILTSRGCPYPCDFCVVPETNNRRWRGNAPADVVGEIIALRDRFGVHDFQVEDLNPTVDHGRWEAICRELIARRAGIRFYLVSGTKAETVRADQIPLLAEAGCRYISISPESGSAALMRVIGKRFDYEHGLRLVRACREAGIRTQACFLVGHPAEQPEDFERSRDYVRQMVRAGLDEIAVFIVAPFAGSSLYAAQRIATADAGALPSFSPRGRPDHAVLSRRRRELIRLFLTEKLRRGLDLWKQGVRSLVGTPQTKMENLPRRVMYVGWRVLLAKLSERTESSR